jgi:hypothetical protein
MGPVGHAAGAAAAPEDQQTPGASQEAEVLARLRAGDERAFESLVEAYHGTMVAVARTYVKTREVAEEVVQETWVGVLTGLDRFEGRSSLRTWIMRILVNTAMTRGGREARTVPFSSLGPADKAEPAVEPERFRPPGEAFAGHWNSYPGDWCSLHADVRRSRAGLRWAPRRRWRGGRQSWSLVCQRARPCSASSRRGSRRRSPGARASTPSAPARPRGWSSGSASTPRSVPRFHSRPRGLD